MQAEEEVGKSSDSCQNWGFETPDPESFETPKIKK